MGTITIGIDLEKSVFAVCELDGGGRVSQRRELRRESFAQWLAQLPAGTVVAIANKHARQAWAMLARREDYDPEAWLRHPMVQRQASNRRRVD